MACCDLAPLLRALGVPWTGPLYLWELIPLRVTMEGIGLWQHTLSRTSPGQGAWVWWDSAHVYWATIHPEGLQRWSWGRRGLLLHR
jgi:hypothetical protein